MVKVKIGVRGFPTTHYGYMHAGQEYEVDDGFAKFICDKMSAATRVEAPPVKKAAAKPGKKSVKKAAKK